MLVCPRSIRVVPRKVATVLGPPGECDQAVSREESCMGIGYFEVMIILVICSFPALLAFIDIVRNEFTGNNKLFWLLAVALFPLFGSLAYFVLGKKQKIS
jgi:hypothetical protein